MARRTYSAFLNALGERESGGNYNAENAYGYLGKYQFGELALRDIGYYTYDGTSANDWKPGFWTGKNGVDSKAEFLANHSAQESAIRAYMSLQWQYMKDAWAYGGQVLDGVKITESGMLAGAHLVGAGNLNIFLLSGGVTIAVDGNNVSVKTYVKQFAGYATPFSANHGQAETIKGGPGDDVLNGRGGNDKLYGRGGHDVLKGGAGEDWLAGGSGADTFKFTSLKQSGVGSKRDTIDDFSRMEGDRIDLRKIDADTDHSPGNQAFKFIGTKKFHKVDGELRYSNHVLQGDVNGDGKADFEIHINVAKLLAHDFLL